MRIARACLLMPVALALASCSGGGWADPWLTRDQQGARAFERGDYSRAASRFEDPMWRGTALYRAERFSEALEAFARVDTAEAWFARGNSLAHLERYEEAIGAYESALSRRSDFPEATANIEYLQPFLPLELEGGVMGTVGRDAAADDVVYDADADRLEQEGRETEVDDESSLLSPEQRADLWLRQVESSPSAFLRHKFRHQVAQR